MKPVIVLMDRDFPPETLGAEESLDLRNITDDAWAKVLSYCAATELRLYGITLRSLTGIDTLRTVSRLEIMWANKLTDIFPIFQMPWLENLSLSDLPLLRSIDGIEALQNLTELHLSGNLGSLHPPLRLDSATPIAKLTKLERLELHNIRLEDRDIAFIASALPNLRALELSNAFDRAQFAYLAKRLNAQLEEPIAAYIKLKITCSKCGESLYLFTGRRMPILCKHCDLDRFEKLSRQFEELIKSS
jgi:hypothetical protein